MEEPIRILLARRIRQLRQARGWSQEDLAEFSGLHRTYIGGIERAERNFTLDTLDKLSQAFGFEVHELLRLAETQLTQSEYFIEEISERN